jgi:poly-beta-1,6-N-acetyl-D-glucosamine synthase
MSTNLGHGRLPRRRRYVLITPCRDEAKHARETLESVAAQSVPPALWVIVDDGSSDETPDILAEYAGRIPYLRVIRRDDRGDRSVGGGVIEAFYEGLAQVRLDDFEYVCKLDLDLRLPPRYFEILMSRMEADPRLGTCSGKAYYEHPRMGRPVSEGIGDDVSLGAAKFYRSECFRQIGGFVRMVMWDGIDCHRCRMLGWRACSWDDPDLRILHLRPMGSSQRGILRGRMRHGEGQYRMGTSLTYMTASAVSRALCAPVLVGSAAMWWGFVRGMLRRAPRYDDRDFRRFLRQYQWSVLLHGKAAALRTLEKRSTPRPSRRGPSRAGESAFPVALGGGPLRAPD